MSRCLVAVSAIVIPDDHNLIENISQFRITHASMVNTQLKRFLRQTCIPKTLKYVLVGGGPVDQALLNRANTIGINCFHTYGLTEMASQVFTHKPNGEGCSLKYRELTIASDGEILVKGDTLFLGYYENGSMKLKLNSEGWFQTNDLGKLKNNHLVIMGRKDNQFISGGENIQPEEVEQYINSLPGVIQSIVVAQNDSEYGSKPVAFIDCESPMTTDVLKQKLIQYIPTFKIPKAVFPWPYTQGLKPNRKILTEMTQRDNK